MLQILRERRLSCSFNDLILNFRNQVAAHLLEGRSHPQWGKDLKRRSSTQLLPWGGIWIARSLEVERKELDVEG